MIVRIINKIHRTLNILKSAYAKRFMRKPKILSCKETIRLIADEHYSISRNGDGEIDIMIGQSIPFQDYNSRLSNIMRRAVSESHDKYISALPDIFNGYDQFNQKAQVYYARYLRIKRWAYYKFAKAPVYGNAFISRFYIDYNDKSGSAERVSNLKRIWENQDVVLVEGKDSKLGVNNDLFDGVNKLVRILGPAKNAFTRYDEIMNAIKTVSLHDTLILLALGPTATAMAYELAMEGYWAVDIGHIDIEYEWMLMGADHKVPVPGKYTNESTESKLTGTLPKEALKKYSDEIIAQII